MKSFNSSNRIVAGLIIGAAALGLVASSVVADTAKTDDQSEAKTKAKIRENSYYYSAFNRRDPFRSLIVGDFVLDKKMTPVDMARVELVGIVRGELDRFALLEDDKGFSYILRIGDRVKNGSVVAIGDESMVARVTNFGQTRKLTLHLANDGEGDKR